MRQNDRCAKETVQRYACRTLYMKLSSADMASKPQQRLPISFCGMLWRLLVLLRPLPALFLVALSFLEAILVFKGGCQVSKHLASACSALCKDNLRLAYLQLAKLLASTT